MSLVGYNIVPQQSAVAIAPGSVRRTISYSGADSTSNSSAFLA